MIHLCKIIGFLLQLNYTLISTTGACPLWDVATFIYFLTLNVAIVEWLSCQVTSTLCVLNLTVCACCVQRRNRPSAQLPTAQIETALTVLDNGKSLNHWLRLMRKCDTPIFTLVTSVVIKQCHAYCITNWLSGNESVGVRNGHVTLRDNQL